MRHFPLLALSLLIACSGGKATDDTDVTTDDDTDKTADTDKVTTEDTDVAEDTDEEGPPNSKADGVWTLTTAGATCDMNFAGGWDGVSSEANTLAFSITQQGADGRTLSCVFDAVNTTAFTCTDQVFGGVIPPSCNVSVGITGISGTVSGTAATLRLTAQRTSPNCAQALNCGPSPHNASGSIAP